MRHRAWTAARIVAVVAAVACMAQTPARAQQGWTPPRTPWGDPDLQGVYSRMHFIVGAVPFERLPALGTRIELTDGELQARMAARDKAAAEGLTRPTGVSFDDVISPYLKPSPRTSVVVDPPDGRIPPFTAEALKRIEAAKAARRPQTLADIGPETFGIEERCLTRGFPTTMNPATPTSAGMQIIQGPGWVVLHFELLNEFRLIPVGPRPPRGPKLREWWGQSRGRWEGNTLIVEVTNFGGGAMYRLAGAEFPVSPQLRVLERFTPISHGEIEYEYTVDDPDTFIRPWTIRASWGRHEQLEINEYACHPGNKDLPVMIRIAQQEFEKRSQQAPETKR